MVDNFAIQNAQVEVGWTVVTVLFRLGWQDKVHQLTQQNLPQKSAIISPFKMLKVEVTWTVVAVLAGLDWLDKVHQLTYQNLPQKLAIISPFKMLEIEVAWTVVAVSAGLGSGQSASIQG